MIYNQTFKLFGPGTVPTCGDYTPNKTLADQLASPGAPASTMHTFSADVPGADDVCQCGMFFYCAAVADSEAS